MTGLEVANLKKLSTENGETSRDTAPMLVQRKIRWTRINTELCQCHLLFQSQSNSGIWQGASEKSRPTSTVTIEDSFLFCNVSYFTGDIFGKHITWLCVGLCKNIDIFDNSTKGLFRFFILFSFWWKAHHKNILALHCFFLKQFSIVDLISYRFRCQLLGETKIFIDFD